MGELTHTTNVMKWMASSKNMGLIITEANTKYILIACHTSIMSNDLIVGLYSYEYFVNNFQYFGININYKIDRHD